ncbi:hypothetical protein CRG98_042521 [Punica granatum]|uniref:DUF7032 domain-containing protein n=1 Tax=Punica granatum TaxID=22663 RepID=A0A2I0HZG1_PUNGR|nr:hypothetical protein CRG98_042521 [Punica granatum]
MKLVPVAVVGGGGGGTDPISGSIDLLSSLLTAIPLCHHFRPKWSLVRAKLSDLQSLLAEFSHLPFSASNPLSLDLLRSLSHTLSDALSLADLCQTPSLPAGKLKTQSELDSVLTRLDRHIADAGVLVKSGVLLQCTAPAPLASSNPSPSSFKREAVRAESRNLITRLQIGGHDSKNSAMDSLLGLLQEDDKNVMVAVAQGVVPVLVKLLDLGSDLEVKEKAVAAISRVSTVESSKHLLIAEGLLLLNHLLRVLESGSGFAREKACVALRALSFSKENAWAIGCRGGISSLLEICVAGTPGSQAFAAGVLRNLAAFREIRENFVEENAVVVLLGLAASGTALAQENAFGCLHNLVSNDENLKLLVVREKGIECLKDYWDSSPSDNRGLEVAIELLTQLASYQPIGEVLVSDGFIPRLCTALSCGAMGVRVAAALCIYELALSPKTKKEIGECGSINVLAKMLDGKAIEEKEAAAKGLSSLLQYAGNRRMFRKEDGGVRSAVQLLDPSILNLDKRYPILVLASLTHSKKCRKRMAAAGACDYLQKLADMDIEGAKKLYGSIRRGNIWNVFSTP